MARGDVGINRVFLDEKKCLHDGSFFCTMVTEKDKPIYTMACSSICGFYMNFDPVWAGSIRDAVVPKDYTHDFWRLNTVAFITEPSTPPTRILPPLAKEGTKL